MKKLALIAFAAITLLTACTKDPEPVTTLYNTRWAYSYTEYTGRKITCDLTLKEKGGSLLITDSYSGQNAWNDRWTYGVYSYTFDGTNGTIYLQHGNAYTEDGTATFRLNDIQSKMYLSTPNGDYTLDRM